MKIFACAVLVASVAGCGSDSTSKPVDAAPVVPAHITVTGTTKDPTPLSGKVLAGVSVAAYQTADENTAVATATSDSAGNYSLDITTNGKPLDGYIKASISGYLDTYLYAPAPIAADYAGASMNVIPEATLENLSGQFCRHAIMNTTSSMVGVVGLKAVDPAGTAIAGAMFTGDPAPKAYCYDGAGGIPDSMAAMTAVDGVGYMLDVSGDVTVAASKNGATFSSHKIKVRPGVLTTTLVVGQ